MTYNARFVFKTKKQHSSTSAFDNKTYLLAPWAPSKREWGLVRAFLFTMCFMWRSGNERAQRAEGPVFDHGQNVFFFLLFFSFCFFFSFPLCLVFFLVIVVLFCFFIQLRFFKFINFLPYCLISRSTSCRSPEVLRKFLRFIFFYSLNFIRLLRVVILLQ